MFGRRCSFSARRGIGHSELIISRYGLRGVRVGEASHPGPPDHTPEDILSDLEVVLPDKFFGRGAIGPTDNQEACD